MTDHPDTLMMRGHLLTDLRYRFGTCAIEIPSLKDRRREIPLLAQTRVGALRGQNWVEGPVGFSNGAFELLCRAEYGGNVRQLEGTVLSAYLLARAQASSNIEVEHLPDESKRGLQFKRRGEPKENRLVVERTLRMTAGNVKRAAERLGISRTTVNATLRTLSRKASGQVADNS
jgi:DNA-binding NtrC family response regulator